MLYSRVRRHCLHTRLYFLKFIDYYVFQLPIERTYSICLTETNKLSLTKDSPFNNCISFASLPFILHTEKSQVGLEAVL